MAIAIYGQVTEMDFVITTNIVPFTLVDTNMRILA